jgi:hypothetical protein
VGTSPLKGKNRGDAALQLRMAGATFDEIAKTLGYRSGAQVQTAVERALAGAVTPEQREKERTLAGKRLERLLRSVWGKANDPDHPEHIAAVRAAKEIIDRHIRLFGQDAPTEIVVHSPTTAELEAWVATVLAYAVPDVDEVDVVDAEEVTDGPTGELVAR